MFRDRLRLTLMLLVLAAAMPMLARADGPAADFKLDADATTVFTSPDETIRLEQYAKDRADDGPLYQFWTFDAQHQHPFLLNPGEGDDLAGYAAGFRFTPDSQWLVRMQKLGAGTSTLFLYRRQGDQLLPATKKPLGDLAWDFMKSRPDWKKLLKAPEYHDSAYMLKGLKENYKDYGVDWPANRYLLIGLSADADVKGRKPIQTLVVNGWHCRYDLQTGKFDVPPIFGSDNAKAVKAKSPGDD